MKDKYLRETRMVDFSNPAIQKLIQNMKWKEMGEFERIKAIYNYVRDDILFGYNIDDGISASKVLADGYGQCNTKGTLFMALLRACNIPCRVHGFTIDKSLQKGTMTGFVYRNAPKNIFHSWVEINFENQWYELEAFILDKTYIKKLQERNPECKGAFCGYGVAVKDFRNLIIEFDRNNTYIQSEGINQDFGVYDCPDKLLKEHHQEISVFKILQCKLKENIYIETFNQDTLKTLNLYDNINGYNNAAGLLADKNHFSGIDIVKFGENISIIQKRVTFEHISVLEIYEKALAVFRDYYQYEVIQGADRKMVEKIPEAAFREAIANALIHRVWDINSHIRVSMFDDRIEVVSPGGLPAGITAEEYLSGKLSILRNRNLANVFYRLGLVEIFGTGITRIKQLYAESLIKPEFEVSENAIKIVLPIFETNVNLTEDEKVIYKSLSKTMLKPISEIAPYVPFGKSKTTQLLKAMEKKGVIAVEGKGRGTKYIIK